MNFKMNNEEWQIIETSQEKMREEYNEEFKNNGNFYNGMTCPYGKTGKFYKSRKKAVKQGQAIAISKKRRGE